MLQHFAIVSSTYQGCNGIKLHFFATTLQYLIGSDYVSGARTNYRNSMCPASGYVTARKNCCKPIQGSSGLGDE